MKMNYNKFFITMIFIVLISSIAALLSPILINIWGKNLELLDGKRIIFLMFILIISLLIKITLIIFREKFAKNYNKNNFKDMLDKYFRLNYDEIVDKGPTNLLERIIMATNSIYTYMTGDSINIWSSILIVFVILIMVVRKSLLIFLIMLMAIPINYIGFRMVNNVLQKKSKKLQESTASGWQKILSITKHTDYLKQFHNYDNLMEGIDTILDDIYGSMADVNIFAQSSSNTLHSLNEIFKVLIMVFTISSFYNNPNFYLDLILISLIIPIYFQNINIITNSNLNKRDMNIVLDLMDEWKEKMELSGKKIIDKIEAVEFQIEKLHLKEKLLSKNIYGKYEKGDIVWIKGPSGVGKSSLIKLLLKYREEDKILINGEDIRELNNNSLRSKVAYLSQDVPIIKGSLRGNLFLNKKYDEKLEEKLRNESLLKSIFKNKDILSQIEENGGNLSGGERQKIAVGRILYDEKDILILDEITSNIDNESSKEIFDRLLLNNVDKIIFIISHDDLPEKYANKKLILKSEA